jgi:hypothetical protein
VNATEVAALHPVNVLIVDLRIQLAEVTRERDALAEALTETKRACRRALAVASGETRARPLKTGRKREVRP